ncbi:MAG TPA: MMPL family transporter [Micromonosporaceae bacterium]|nr:MMPL family transporter [Micromonosporaceae bacterium]
MNIKRSLLERYALFIHGRARAVLIIAGLALVAAALYGAGAFGVLKNGGFDDPHAQSSQAQRLIDQNFGGRSNLVLLVHAKNGTVDSPDVKAAATDLTSRLAGEPTVANVVSYWQTGAPQMKSTNGQDAIITAHIVGDDTQIVTRAQQVIDEYAGDHGSFTAQAAGDAAVNVDVRGQVGSSLAIAESIAVPVTMLLLLLAFGSVVAAAIPLVIGLVAIAGTFGELHFLGGVTDVSVFAINLTTAMGLGLAIDYALLLVSRFREQLGKGADVPEAVARTVATAGRTIVFSAAAVAAALAALLVFPMFFLRSFAYAGIGVVVIAATAALVVVPALLSVLGPRVNRLRLPFARVDRGPASPFWGRAARSVMRRPVLAALPVVAVLVLAALPLGHVRFGTPDQGVLAPGASSRVVADTIRDTFPGNDSSVIDVVSTSPVDAGAWAGYATTLSRLPGVAAVQSAEGTYTAGTAGPASPAASALTGPRGERLQVITTVALKSDAAQKLVHAVRDTATPAGVTTLVGGADAQLVDSTSSMGSHLPAALALIVVTTFVLLFLFTGSLVQPIRALVLNALSLSATLGIITWIFQDGHLSGLLGFTPRPMDTSMTVLLFCIAFGLSMDYELFVTSRIKELADAGEPTPTAVGEGLARTGRIVTTAAGLLAVSFFAFGTASVSFLQMFGIGTGLAILIDATLVRGVLVPVAMKVLGRAAWWAPAPLRRVHARIGLSEA